MSSSTGPDTVTELQQPLHRVSADDPRPGAWACALRVGSYPALLWQNRELVWNFFRRDLLGKFRGSALGLFWVLLEPAFQFLVLFAVFGVLFADPQQLAATGPDPAFAAYLFAGIIVFSPAMDGANGAMTSIVSKSDLVKKVAFPCEILPLSPVLVAGIVSVVGGLLLIAIGIPTGVLEPSLRLLALPLIPLMTTTFVLGLGMLLASLFVFARDIQMFFGILSRAWFFGTPIFWPVSMLEDKVPGVADWLLINPMYCYVMGFRQAIGANYEAREIPTEFGTTLAVGACWAVIALALGYGMFRARRHAFSDLV